MQQFLLTLAAAVVLAGIVFIAIRLVDIGAWRKEAGRGLAMVLRFLSLMLVAFGVWGVLVLITGVPDPLIGWLIVMTVLVRATIHWRETQQRSLFGALALAVDKHMPLAPMVRAFANERRGFGGRARRLAAQLEGGVPLVDAIAKSGGALPAEAAMTARVAQASGDFRGALQATSSVGSFDRTLLQTVLSRLFYFWPFVLMFLLFMSIKIAPSYIKIFDDFGTTLPPITTAMMGASTTSFLIELCVVLMIATLLILVWGWWEWRGSIQPKLPVLRPVIKWVDMGVVLRVLALAARRDCPLPQMLAAVAESHPKRWIRQRLEQVAIDIKEGCSWQKSLEVERLIAPADRAILSAAERSGNLQWALDQMADSYQRKATYRLQAVGQVLFPLMMLPIGILVCLLVVAYFSPLTHLIESLS